MGGAQGGKQMWGSWFKRVRISGWGQQSTWPGEGIPASLGALKSSRRASEPECWLCP